MHENGFAREQSNIRNRKGDVLKFEMILLKVLISLVKLYKQ